MSAIQNIPEARKHQGNAFGAYQGEIYFRGMFHNVRPTVTCDPNKLEKQAKDAMGDKSFAYVAGGAGERATMDANRLAFRSWKVGFDYCGL
jgi:hypothetical protein